MALQVRKVPFAFGDDTPFQWNPIVTALRQAMPRIGDPAIVSEADAFLRQEAQHARVHRLHVAALTRQYPGLAEVTAELERRFDRLLETQPLEFHLAKEWLGLEVLRAYREESTQAKARVTTEADLPRT